MKGAKFDLIETGGGAASSTLISPKLHREFCLPYDRKMHDALHDLGFKITYHTCGGTRGIEELIVANGCRRLRDPGPAERRRQPGAVGVQAEGRQPHRLIGGHRPVQHADRRHATSEIRAMVHRLFETVGHDGGYICSCSDHFFETPVENLVAFADAAKECVYA